MKVHVLEGTAKADPCSYDSNEDKSMFLDAGDAVVLKADDFDFEDIPETQWWDGLEEFDDPGGNSWVYWIVAVGLIILGLSLYAKRKN